MYVCMCVYIYIYIYIYIYLCVCVCVSFFLVNKSKCPTECLTDLFSEHRKVGTLFCSVIQLTVVWLYPHCYMMQPPIHSRRLSGLVRNVAYPAVEYTTFANYVCVVEEYYPKFKKKNLCQQNYVKEQGIEWLKKTKSLVSADKKWITDPCVFFVDDTQLTCSIDLNSQNSRFWYYKNCSVIHGVLLSDLKGQ